MEKLPAIEEYVLRSKLGESSLSTVWEAEHRITGQVVALKQIQVRKLTRRLKNCLECELSFLSSVNHPNIIRLHDVLEDEIKQEYIPQSVNPKTSALSKKASLVHLLVCYIIQVMGCIVLVLELCAGGNLASYIRRCGRVQECTAKRFMQQLGAGLKVLRLHNIIHRDLKPENILLSSCECDPVLKIADFGLSRILRPDEYAETVCGSPMYMAPEVLEFQRYDEKVDMWSIGAILFELLNGCPPFHGRTSVQLLQNIKASTSPPFSQLVLPQLHPDSIDLCTRLLSTNPDNRLSFDEFYQHNFLQIGKWSVTSEDRS